MAGGSKAAVYAAIGGNTLVMISKFAAFAVTGSAAMLSEGIHSVADVGNQALLALGIHKSAQGPSPEHPYGMQRDRFIWALISAVGIFFLGCGVTVYHGVQTLLHPHPLEGSVGLLLGVLALSLLIEGSTLLVAYRAVRRQAGTMSTVDYVRSAQDPMATAVLMEDSAAVTGVLIAAASIGLTVITGQAFWDGVGSILIGLMLGVAAIVLVRRNRELLLGETPDREVVQRIEALLAADPAVAAISDVKAVIVGAEAIRFKAEVDFDGRAISARHLVDEDLDALYARAATPEGLREVLIDYGETLVQELGKTIDELEDKVQQAVPNARYVDLETDR